MTLRPALPALDPDRTEAAAGEGAGRVEEKIATMRIRHASAPTKAGRSRTLSPIRKVCKGIAARHQMFRMFDGHAGRPNRWEGDDSVLYRGE